MIVDYNGSDINLPDIFLVGAAKCGTTTVASILDQHEHIAIPRKEPGFFSHRNKSDDDIDAVNRNRQVSKIEDYIKLYENIGEASKIADCSVRYLVTHEDTIKNIKEIYGEYKSQNLKILIILRNPIDRAFSHYNMLLKNGYEKLTFEEAILPENTESRRKERLGFDYLNHGLYYEQVKAYLDNFKNVKVYLFEELKNSESFTEDLFVNLDLDVPEIKDTNISLNPSGIPKKIWLIRLLNRDSVAKRFLKKHFYSKHKHSFQKIKAKLMRMSIEKNTMSVETREELKDFFREDVLKLQDLLGVDLTQWIQKSDGE